MSAWFDKIKKEFPFTASVAGYVGAFVTSITAGNASGQTKWQLIAIGILSTAVPVYIARRDGRISEDKVKEQEAASIEIRRGHEQLVAGVSQGVRHLAAISEHRSGTNTLPLATAMGRLDQTIVSAASEVHGETHAAFYRFDQATAEFMLEAERPLGAVAKKTVGDFGYSAFFAVATTGGVFRRSSTRSPLREPIPTLPDRAIVIVQVRALTTALGVLVVDAPNASWPTGVQPRDFTDLDMRQFLLYADALAAGLYG